MRLLEAPCRGHTELYFAPAVELPVGRVARYPREEGQPVAPMTRRQYRRPPHHEAGVVGGEQQWR
jgi:hypothetical protein